jgi:hypothetical protein
VKNPFACDAPFVTRALMRVHVCFLMVLPFLAIVAAGMVLERNPSATLLWGFVPGVVFSTAIAASYRIPASPVSALALVLAVPLQIALGVVLFGAGPWAFVLEEAFVEVGALSTGIAVAMFVHRPTGALGVVVGAAMIAGSAFAYLPALLRTYEGAHPGWYLFLASAFLTSAYFHARLFVAAAGEYVSSGAPQSVPLRYGGRIARLLRLEPPRETVGPELGHDGLVVAILLFVGLYILGGMAACVLIEIWHDPGR